MDIRLTFPHPLAVPPSLKTAPFFTIGIFWVASSPLLSCEWETSEIIDRGSFVNSIKDEGIDPFLHRRIKAIPDSLLSKIIVNTLRVAALAGIIVGACPLGCLWHFCNSAYYLVIWIKTGKEWPHFIAHITSFAIDFILGPLALGSTSLHFMSEKKVIQLQTHFLFKQAIIVGRSIWIGEQVILLTFFIERLFLSCFFSRRTGFHSSLLLKKHFGLVGKGGWLLNFNSEVDGFSTAEDNKDYFELLYDDKLSSLLENIRALIFLFDLKLDYKEVESFSKNFSSSLEQIKDKIELSLGENKELLAELNKSTKIFREVEEILYFQCRRLVPSSDYCSPFLPVLDNKASFFEQLGLETSLSNLKEGGPSEDYKQIKKNIQTSANFYQAFGLESGACMKEIEKKYKEILAKIHPDKCPLEWRRDAELLTQIVNEAKVIVLKPLCSNL